MVPLGLIWRSILAVAPLAFLLLRTKAKKEKAKEKPSLYDLSKENIVEGEIVEESSDANHK